MGSLILYQQHYYECLGTSAMSNANASPNTQPTTGKISRGTLSNTSVPEDPKVSYQAYEGACLVYEYDA